MNASAIALSQPGEPPVTISDPKQIISVLTSPQFDVVDYAPRYARLGEALKLDFSHILRTLEFVPICVESAKHAPLRRQIGELIAADQVRVRNMAPLVAAGLLAPLRQAGDYDLVSAVLKPYVQKTLRLLSGISLDESVVDHSLLSALFSQSIGVARRKRLNDQLGTVWNWLDQVYAHETESQRGVRLALIILGFDATLGTLAGSLHAALPNGPIAFNALEFASAPTRTGVPYVDRRAIASANHPAAKAQADGLARVRLDAFEADERAHERHRFFGAGAHACLGRALATDLWRTLCEALQGLPGQIEVLDLVWAHSDVLRVPEVFWVRVSHD